MAPSLMPNSPTRRLLTRLRAIMAAGAAELSDIVALVASELVAEVCSAYALRAGEILELRATHGLNALAVGRTRLRVGEGIVGLVAATGQPLNLADAQNHPAFAYRPETGEEPYASMLAVPVRRGGRTLGVLVVQNRAARHYADDELDVLETVAMLLADRLAAGGGGDSSEGFAGSLPRQFDAATLSPGIVFGPIMLRGTSLSPGRLLADDPASELDRLRTALDQMRRGLDSLIETQLPSLGQMHGDAPRDILDATRAVAADDGWLRRVAEAVRGGLTAEAAVHRVANDFRVRMRKIVDPYLRERLADLEDLAGRLLACLAGRDAELADATGAILLVRRLGPAQLLAWHARGIAGVVIEEGSPGGHAAIVARALGLPAAGGARGAIDAAAAGDQAVLDADEGTLILRPDPGVRGAYARALEARAIRAAGQQGLRDAPCLTSDGTPFTLMMNAGLALELDQLDSTAAAGIGLFRTEIAMMARGAIPDVAEQAAIYAKVLDVAGTRPVLFRTLDLGSDKLLPDSPRAEEENPAMGWRSLRVGLDRPAILRRQLRALLLAAAGRPLSLMFPMVATLQEFRQARGLLFAEAARVRPAPERLAVGTMLEVPALFWQLPELLAEADFISIGSNDLTQFVFAADRGTPALAERYDFLSVPMLRLIAAITQQASQAGVPLSLCGEAASHPLDAAVLLAIGVDRLSMPASSLLAVKEALTMLDLSGFKSYLTTLRRTASSYSSLREPIGAWARDHGLKI
jgi:phosphotransferase system enzyme I (PtsP)